MSTNYEFSFPVSVAKVGQEVFKVDFSATERQRAMLARRFGILSVDSLKGTARLVRENDGMTILVTGRFVADVTQACVATLEPVPDHIDEDFEGWFLDESQVRSFKKAKKARVDADVEDPFGEEDEETMMPSEREDPEPVTGGIIDVGELVSQYLSLALDPYPRSEQALAVEPVSITQEKPNPFEVLKDLKK
jgi:uncharacterized metal-binding protein YceD (DUF177 family)